jgi:hypothetical protein
MSADDGGTVDWQVLDDARCAPPPPAPRRPIGPINTSGVTTSYAATALANECANVSAAVRGKRNDTLNLAAFNLGQLVAGSALNHDDVRAALLASAADCGLTDHEASATTHSGMLAGMKHPRYVVPTEQYGLAGLVLPGAAPPANGVAGRTLPAVPLPGTPGSNGHTPTEQPTQPNVAAEPSERTSWWMASGGRAAAEVVTAPAPTHLIREDGEALCYSGKVNGLIGESESGKTWVALLAIAQALKAGERVGMLDFEDSVSGIVGRLRTLGVDDEALDERFNYASPDESLGLAQSRDLSESLLHNFTLIVVDGVNAAMTQLDYDLNSNTDATLFATKLLRPLAKTGACVITVDHVPKNADARGKGGIGAQAKRAMMDGCALAVEVVRPFGVGQDGVLRLKVDKDRPGRVRGISQAGERAGDARLTSDGELVDIVIVAPDLRSLDERGPFRPTGLMEKVSRYLETVTGTVTTTGIVSGVSSKKEYVRAALSILATEGYVTFTTGARGSHDYTLVASYHQADDPESDEYRSPGPAGPTGSHRVPGPGHLTGSRFPPPYKGDQVTVNDEDPADEFTGTPEGYQYCNGCGQLIPDWVAAQGRWVDCPRCR